MTYKLHVDNKMWVEGVYNEEMEKLRSDVGSIVDDHAGFYWITSTEREEILKVGNFIDGEDIITELNSEAEDEVDNFEEAVDKYNHTEIQDERPPQ